MTNKEILKKILGKVGTLERNGKDSFFLYSDEREYVLEALKNNPKSTVYYAVIFNNNFAEAFWGDGWICKTCGNEAEYRSLYDEEGVDGTHCDNCGITEIEDFSDEFIRCSQYHQHKMLDEIQAGRNPLLYLEKFL